MTHRKVRIIFVCLLALEFPLGWWFPSLHRELILTTAILFISYAGLTAYGAFVVSARYFIPVRCKGPADSGAIALTFDDGPLPEKTLRILDILKANEVTGAFFCIGKRVEKNPELIRQIHEEGHLVCNHTFSHATLFDLKSSRLMFDELRDTDRVVKETIYRQPRFFRPPYGITNPNLAKAVARRGYVTIGWSVRSFDTIAKDKAKLLERVTRKLSGGDIILFHDYCDITAEILPDFIRHVKSLGLKFVRVDQLLNEPAYAQQI